MCTVVYRYSAGHLLLAMNRDERRGRAPESPPETRGGEPIRWIAPSDGEKGGTWIAVNDRGLAACLINGYAPGDLALFARSDVPSRGGIIPDLLGSRWPNLDDWIRHSLQAESYPSFTLLVWGPDGGRQIRWRLDEGLTCSRLPNDCWGMETSSFWRTDEVLAWRRDLFDRWLADGAPFEGRLPSFNVIEEPGRREWSPFMSRSFSATRSITLVEVDRDRDRTGMAWWPRPAEGAINPDTPGSDLHLAISTGATR